MTRDEHIKKAEEYHDVATGSRMGMAGGVLHMLHACYHLLMALVLTR